MKIFAGISNEYALKQFRLFLSVAFLIFVSMLFSGCGKVTAETGGGNSGGSESTYTPVTPAPIPEDYVAFEECTFMMGGYADNPLREVKLNKFAMAQKETTQAEFEAIMGYNPSCFDDINNYNHPVEMVSWYEAVQYAIRKTMQEQKIDLSEYLIATATVRTVYATKADSSNKYYSVCNDYLQRAIKEDGWYRLPTEAEWEYACRGGTTTMYPWGEDDWSTEKANQYSWNGENSGYSTHAVGGKQANDYDMYDMSGNVWEWCIDIHYGNFIIMRGGDWNTHPVNLRSADRLSDYADLRDEYTGFRLARTVK